MRLKCGYCGAAAYPVDIVKEDYSVLQRQHLRYNVFELDKYQCRACSYTSFSPMTRNVFCFDMSNTLCDLPEGRYLMRDILRHETRRLLKR